MKCKRTKLLLSYNNELGLNPKRKETLAEHLEKCKICRKEVDVLETTVKIISEMEEIDPPRDYLEVIRKCFNKH